MNVLNYSALIERETALEKKRASALARQQWHIAIELEARINECKLWRKKLAEPVAEKDENEKQITTTPANPSRA